MLKRVLYLFYYIKKLDYQLFKSFVNHTKANTTTSSFRIALNAFWATLNYNISILEYFQFGFPNLVEEERRQYLGTGAMYEYQLKMNPKKGRDKLEDKVLFLKYYNAFVKRDYLLLEEIRNDLTKLKPFFDHPSKKVVLKLSTGQVGAEVKVISLTGFTPERIFKKMEDEGFDLLEEFVIQHPKLMELSPSGLNTIRVITQIDDGKVIFLGARLRVSVNSEVDNLAAGNMACSVDLKSGKVNGNGVYSDITKSDAKKHPITNVQLLGFQIPFWNEAMEMVEKAALFDTSNRSIGWDVTITEKGPELIEGNHNWCKLLWQLPVKKGLRAEIEKYL